LLLGQAILAAHEYDRYTVALFMRTATCPSLNP
jgi:hypothetical protein